MSCKGCVRRPLVFSVGLQMDILQVVDNQYVMNKHPAVPPPEKKPASDHLRDRFLCGR